MSNTFTKFDALGSVLTEISHRAVSLHMTRDKDGSVSHWTVFIHNGANFETCVQGIGDTPSDALGDALQHMARTEALQIETAAGQAVAS